MTSEGMKYTKIFSSITSYYLLLYVYLKLSKSIFLYAQGTPKGTPPAF